MTKLEDISARGHAQLAALDALIPPPADKPPPVMSGFPVLDVAIAEGLHSVEWGDDFDDERTVDWNLTHKATNPDGSPINWFFNRDTLPTDVTVKNSILTCLTDRSNMGASLQTRALVGPPGNPRGEPPADVVGRSWSGTMGLATWIAFDPALSQTSHGDWPASWLIDDDYDVVVSECASGACALERSVELDLFEAMRVQPAPGAMQGFLFLQSVNEWAGYAGPFAHVQKGSGWADWGGGCPYGGYFSPNSHANDELAALFPNYDALDQNLWFTSYRTADANTGKGDFSGRGYVKRFVQPPRQDFKELTSCRVTWPKRTVPPLQWSYEEVYSVIDLQAMLWILGCGTGWPAMFERVMLCRP